MERFWNIMYRLKVVKRWGTSFCQERESIAEHCYFVAILTHILATIDQTINGTNVDMNKLIIQALYHDTFECYTAHTISPIKHHDNVLYESMEHLRQDYTQRLFNLLPNEYRDTFNKITMEQNQTINAYIKIADSIEAYCYCAFQVHLGNRDFENKLKITKNNIRNLMNNYNFVKIFFEELFDENEFEIIY